MKLPGIAVALVMTMLSGTHVVAADACSLPPTKSWHVSPSGGPESSTAYHIVAWDRVERVRVGMCQAEAEEILGSELQYYHHPVNAIVFSWKEGCGFFEVAFRLSNEHCVLDVSYKGPSIEEARP